jgi:hypothetical protein
MKKLTLLVCALFVVAGVASASQATTPAAPAKPAVAPAPAKAAVAPVPAKAVAPAVAKKHIVEAEVVSADAVAKTLTVKTEQGESTMKVDAVAAKHLKTLKAGEKVKLTCRDNDKGEHEAISHITVEKAPAKAATKK